MTRIKLEKATRRINIYDYTLIEYAEFLESFWGRRILIETEDKTIGIIKQLLQKAAATTALNTWLAELQ